MLEESGYQLLLINTANNPQKELRALDTLCRHTVDGILLIATVYTPEHKAVLERMHVPLVVLGQQFPGCCSVYHDDFGAAQAATAHMLAKGRHAPGYIGVTLLDKAAGQQRRAGFEAAVRTPGCRCGPSAWRWQSSAPRPATSRPPACWAATPASTACSAPPTPLLWVPCSTAGRQASASRRM